MRFLKIFLYLLLLKPGAAIGLELNPFDLNPPLRTGILVEDATASSHKYPFNDFEVGDPITRRLWQEYVSSETQALLPNQNLLSLYYLAPESTSGISYPPNSYLVGFSPMTISSYSEAVELIKKKVIYAVDEKYFERSDSWQTSAQVWANKVGDCEDHAILLVDWLLSSGFEARVVVGQEKSGQKFHAFVELNYSSKSLLLEATEKKARLDYRKQHRELSNRYKAIYAFDRTTVWYGDILQREGTSIVKKYKFIEQ